MSILQLCFTDESSCIVYTNKCSRSLKSEYALVRMTKITNFIAKPVGDGCENSEISRKKTITVNFSIALRYAMRQLFAFVLFYLRLSPFEERSRLEE